MANISAHTAAIEILKTLTDNRLASGSDDTTVKIWNTTNGYLIETLYGHQEPVFGLDQLKNGYLCSGSYDLSIKVWDLDDFSLVHTIITNISIDYLKVFQFFFSFRKTNY